MRDLAKTPSHKLSLREKTTLGILFLESGRAVNRRGRSGRTNRTRRATRGRRRARTVGQPRPSPVLRLCGRAARKALPVVACGAHAWRTLGQSKIL